MQANQPENYNIQMNEGEVGRLNAMIDPNSNMRFPPGLLLASFLGRESGCPLIPTEVISLILANKFVKMSDLLNCPKI